MIRMLIVLRAFNLVKNFREQLAAADLKINLLAKRQARNNAQSHPEDEDRYKTRLNFNFVIKNKVLECRWQTFLPLLKLITEACYPLYSD